MFKDPLKNCNLFKLMSDGGETCTVEKFREILKTQRNNVPALEKFFASSERMGTWDVGILANNPRILETCAYIGVEGLVDIAIEYGVMCDERKITMIYFNGIGEPVLGSVMKEIIEKRRTDSNDIFDCAVTGATITLIRIVRSLRAAGAKINQLAGIYALETAARHGHLEIIEYLHKTCDIPLTDKAVTAAVYGGHVDVLKYLFSNGCRRTLEAMNLAVSYGMLDMIIYLHSAGCPWDSDIFDVAVQRGRMVVITYLHKNGCPWRAGTALKFAERGGNKEVYDYLSALCRSQQEPSRNQKEYSDDEYPSDDEAEQYEYFEED